MGPFLLKTILGTAADSSSLLPSHWSFLGKSWWIYIPWSVQRNSRVTGARQSHGLGLMCLSPERVYSGILALHFAFDLFISVLPACEIWGWSGDSRGNQAEMHLCFQKTEFCFCLQSQISTISRGSLGWERLSVHQLCGFYQELIFNHKLSRGRFLTFLCIS